MLRCSIRCRSLYAPNSTASSQYYIGTRKTSLLLQTTIVRLATLPIAVQIRTTSSGTTLATIQNTYLSHYYRRSTFNRLGSSCIYRSLQPLLLPPLFKHNYRFYSNVMVSCEPVKSSVMSSSLPPAIQMAVDATLNTRVLSTAPDKISFEYNLPANDTFSCTDTATQQALIASSEALHFGLPVGMPTETVYGLAANALDATAVKRIFDAKGRPSDNPLIVHISSIEMLERVVAPWSTLYSNKESDPIDTTIAVDSTKPLESIDTLNDRQIEEIFNRLELPVSVRRIIRQGWPGPLTLLLPRHPNLPLSVTCGRSTVGIRFPAHPMARAMIAHANLPLAAPSANTSGRPSPTRASHVFDDLHGRIPLILDAGSCEVGVESTVLDCTRTPPAILRPGGITDEEIRQWGGSAFNKLQVYQRDFSDAQLEAAPTTPGMKYRHYSPTAPVILFELKTTYNSATNRADKEAMIIGRQQLRQCVLDKAKELYESNGSNAMVGLLCVEDEGSVNNSNANTIDSPFICRYNLGAWTRPDQVAHRLFDGLRTLDAVPHLKWILVEGVLDYGQGIAVMNRLRKAASNIIQVSI
ncbi:DHBP synthase RibB-like alpha/beta domain-containing protein [Syncephalis fuscata]|nr:DHBP synthase RibB-like alpha/beta domain-containing protein [Syncephalis fuscata]